MSLNWNNSEKISATLIFANKINDSSSHRVRDLDFQLLGNWCTFSTLILWLKLIFWRIKILHSRRGWITILPHLRIFLKNWKNTINVIIPEIAAIVSSITISSIEISYTFSFKNTVKNKNLVFYVPKKGKEC